MDSKNYKSGMNDAWALAKELKNDYWGMDSGLSKKDICDKYGVSYEDEGSIIDRIYDNDPEEVMESVKKYNEKINLGDEVVFENNTFIVTCIKDNCMGGIDLKGETYIYSYDPSYNPSIKKTGRKYANLIQVLDDLKTGESNCKGNWKF